MYMYYEDFKFIILHLHKRHHEDSPRLPVVSVIWKTTAFYEVP